MMELGPYQMHLPPDLRGRSGLSLVAQPGRLGAHLENGSEVWGVVESVNQGSRLRAWLVLLELGLHSCCLGSVVPS